MATTRNQVISVLNKLRLQENYLAMASVGTDMYDGKAQMEEKLKEYEAEGTPKAGYIFYSCAMNDSFDRRGKQVRTLVLHWKGDSKLLVQAFRDNGIDLCLHYVGGKNVFEIRVQ